MTRPCSFIRTRLAVFLFSVAIITSPTIFAANDSDSTISIHNPLYGQLDNGTLVTSCSYRTEDNKTHLEVIRWKLPEFQKAVEVHRPIVKVLECGESKVQPEDCLATLVGPGINQPDPYPGYGGFVGWVGTLLCSVFTYPGTEQAEVIKNPALACHVAIIRSFNHGKSWDQEIIRLPSPFLSDGTDGPMVLLKDGTVLHTIYGTPMDGGPEQAAVFTSKDNRAMWQLLSILLHKPNGYSLISF
jgi:hypothetical protein